MATSGEETPHPPATAEFGHVEQGGGAHLYPEMDGIRVKKFSVGPLDNNVYVVESEGEALVIDGAAEPGRILSEVEGIEVEAILETHNHPDHTGALSHLVEALGVRILAHPEDPLPVPTEPLFGGTTVRVGGAGLRVLHTPGHTPGSLCFLLETPQGTLLFSGDTLFPGGPGGTGGSPERFAEIMRSLDELFRLPDDTRVLPGHGLDTTIGRERPHVEVWRTRGW